MSIKKFIKIIILFVVQIVDSSLKVESDLCDLNGRSVDGKVDELVVEIFDGHFFDFLFDSL